MGTYLLFGLLELIATIVAVQVAWRLTRTKKYQTKQWVTDVLTTVLLVLFYGGVLWLWNNTLTTFIER